MEERLALAKRLEVEILGPESSFVIKRSGLKQDWAPIIERTKDISITDAESKELAVGFARLLQASSKEVTDLFTSVKQQIDAVKKPVLAAEKEDLGAISTAKDALGLKVLAWNKEQDRIHAEAVRKAQEEARRLEQERILAEAIAAEALGEKEEAEQILNEPIMEAPAIVQKAPAKVAGEVSTTRYSAEVTNLLELVRAVAERKVPLQAVVANETWLNRQAISFREGLGYPGVTVRSKSSISFRE